MTEENFWLEKLQYCIVFKRKLHRLHDDAI